MADEQPPPVIILCGGRGTRLSEVSTTVPKPLVPVGDRPILWHIMKIYAAHGCRDFVLALGWLGEKIRRYFIDYHAMTRDITIEIGTGALRFHGAADVEPWKVTCCDTGRDALTGTRVRRAAELVEAETIMVSYGDGVGDVDITALLEHHRSEGRLATVTTVHPPSRFGELIVGPGHMVDAFEEKPQVGGGSVNGGFLVFEKEALRRYFPVRGNYMLEREPLSQLAADGQLTAFEHTGFWQPMDTPREHSVLEQLWTEGNAPWKVWADGG